MQMLYVPFALDLALLGWDPGNWPNGYGKA